MNNCFFCGIMIGLLFGVPVGAVGAMTVQRTLRYGVKEGLLTGLGSSVADCIYAGIGAFGLVFVSEFLLSYQTAINIIGGSFILLMGLGAILAAPRPVEKGTKKAGTITLFVSSFIIGITNPAAILTFLFAFSFFDLTGDMSISEAAQLVIGVFIGTYIWWGCISFGVGMLKRKLKMENLQKANKGFGIILIIFGFVVLLRTASHLCS